MGNLLTGEVVLKKLIKLLIFSIVLLGTFYLVLAFQVRYDDDGFQIVAKNELGLKETVVKKGKLESTVDRLKRKVDDMDWKSIKGKAKSEWSELTDQLDDLFEDNSKDSTFENKVADLKKDAEKRYDKLVKKLEKGDFSQERFEKEFADLKKWFEKQLKKIQN